MAARLAQAVLTAAPQVRILVTSQAPLRIGAEAIYRLGPLALPDAALTVDQSLGFGAVALFVQRARAADRRFELNEQNLAAVLALCRRLDGLPLALELAAARVPLLGVKRLADALDQRFRLLTSGVRVDVTDRKGMSMLALARATVKVTLNRPQLVPLIESAL